MNFADHLIQVTTAKTSTENILTDGLLTCHYAEIPALLNNLDKYLTAQGVKIDDCVAVECLNSVPSALVLMLLLQKEQGFVLLPVSEKKDQVSELKPIPQFCQYRLIIKSVSKANAEIALQNPELFLTVDVYNGTQIEARGKLFSRTSGSMGTAKIVVHDHASLLGSAANAIAKYQFTAEDRFAIPVPIFHLYGCAAEILPALMLGASVDLQEKTNLLKYLDRERRFNPTVAFITPNLCEMLLQGRKNPRQYKVIVVSGQRIKEELFRAFDPLCGNRLVNQYGSTEMGPIAACFSDDSLESRATSIGQPMGGVKLRIKENGNLYCNHPYCFAGYMDEMGNWLYHPEEWHRTGDVAAYSEDGTITVTGRADNSINRSGYLILLADVERLIEKLDYIAQVVVITIKAETIQGRKLVACCILKSNESIVKIEKIRDDCKNILPSYALPDEILLLKEFSLLPSGKIDQQALSNLAEKIYEHDTQNI